MRKFGLFLCLSLLFAFTGCSDSDDVEEQGGTVLAKPTVVVTTTTSAAFKVKWDAVPNAESYKYRLSQENESGEEITVQSELATSANALAFSDLNPKTKYILRVKAVAAGGSGLADSDYAKIFAVTLAEEPTALTFEKIAATNPTYESVDVEIVPSAENLYYWQVVENSLVADKSDREIVTALKENISELTSGTVKKTIHGLKAETEYTIVAFGYDIDANKSTSAVARLEKAFTTPADTRMTIRIAVGEVSDDNAHVTFTPSVADGRYFADVIAAADAAGKSDMEIVALLQAKYGAAMTDIARTGKYESDFAVEANKEYSVVAFAYDVANSELTSAMFSEQFATPLADGNKILSITLSNPSAFALDYTITSSDPDMYYTEIIIPTAKLSQFDEKTQAAALISDINSLCAQYGLEMVLSICHKGNITDTFSGLNPNTEYTLFAIGIAPVSGTETVEAVTTFAMSKNSITTGKEDEITTNAWTDITSVMWEMQDAGPAIFFMCQPNASSKNVKIASWSINVPEGMAPPTSLESITGLDSETNVRQMTISKGGDLDMKRLYSGRMATAGTVYVFAAVSQDADGNFGHVNWVITQMPKSLSGDYGECTILGQSAANNSGGGETPEEPTEAYSKYLGTWTVTSTTSLVSQKPLTFDITIAQDQANASYAVTGWSISSLRNEIPVRWNYETYEDGDLIMLPTQKIAAFDDPDLATTVTVDYQPFCKIYSQNLYTPIRFEYGSELIGGMMMEDKFLIIGLTNENVGSSSSPMYIDAYTMDFFYYYTTAEGNMVGTYKPAPEFTQNDYPVGPFMLTKKSDATNSTAKRKSSTIPVNTFAIRSMSSVLRDLTVVQPQLSIVDKVKKLGSNGEKSQMRQIEKGEGHFQVCQPDDKRIFKHRLSQLLR